MPNETKSLLFHQVGIIQSTYLKEVVFYFTSNFFILVLDKLLLTYENGFYFVLDE